MKTAAKVSLVIATLLILAGIIGLVSVMTMKKWDFSSFGEKNYETRKYDIEEDFRDISLDTETAKIRFERSADGKCHVEVFEEDKVRHSVAAENGTLTVKTTDTRKWTDYMFNFYSKTPTVTVYLPGTEYGRLSVKGSTGDVNIPEDFSFESIDIASDTGDVSCGASVSGKVRIALSTGDIKLEKISAGELDLTVSTGKISVESASVSGDVKITVSTGKSELTALSCRNFSTKGSTGVIRLNDVIAEEKLSIERSTGDVRFTDCDAAEIYVKTDTGDVEGNLLTEKVFITKTDTGRIRVPDSVTGGKCEIRTDTGNIEIEIR